MVRQNIQSTQIFFRGHSLKRSEIFKIARVAVHHVRHKLEPVERCMSPDITLPPYFEFRFIPGNQLIFFKQRYNRPSRTALYPGEYRQLFLFFKMIDEPIEISLSFNFLFVIGQ